MILSDCTNKCDLKLCSEIRVRSEALFRLIDNMPHLTCLIINKTTMYTNKSIGESLAHELKKYIINHCCPVKN